MRCAVLVLSSCLLLASSAQAQTQHEMNIEAQAGYARADRELNAVYGAVMARLAPAEKSKLTAAQRAWIRYRDAECAFIAMGTQGGSVQPMIRSGCLERLTRARVTSLRASTLDCREGDLSCVGR